MGMVYYCYTDIIPYLRKHLGTTMFPLTGWGFYTPFSGSFQHMFWNHGHVALRSLNCTAAVCTNASLIIWLVVSTPLNNTSQLG